MSTADFPSSSILEEEEEPTYLLTQRTSFVEPAAGLDLSKEAIWLLAGLFFCAFMIIGCACCSLRFTKMQQRRRIDELEDVEEAGGNGGLRPKYRSSVNGGVSGGSSFGASIGQEISFEFDNSMDMTSSSAK